MKVNIKECFKRYQETGFRHFRFIKDEGATRYDIILDEDFTSSLLDWEVVIRRTHITKIEDGYKEDLIKEFKNSSEWHIIY